MPSVPLIVVLVLNLLVSVAYLVLGLLVTPLMRRRQEEEAQLTRAELLERYRAAQGEGEAQADEAAAGTGEEPAAEPDPSDAPSVEAQADAAVEVLLAAGGAEEPRAQEAADAAQTSDAEADVDASPQQDDGAQEGSEDEGAADPAEQQAGFKTRVLDDRPDVVTDGPSILASVEAAQSEYSPLRIVLNTLVMLACPVAGPLFFGLSWLLKNVVFRKPVDVADVIFSKARVKPAEEADPEHEMNIAPLTEAVSITDGHHLRTLMLNVLSGEMNASLASISEALASDDSESAHYAASYLSDAVNKLRADTQKLYLQVLEDAEGSERVIDYAIERAQAEAHEAVLDEDRAYVRHMLLVDGCTRYLDQAEAALKQGIFTPLETEELVRNMERIGGIFYEEAPGEMQPEHYESLALRLQQIADEDAADLWIARDREVHGEQLSYYTCRLQILYARRDREAFFEALDELKNSSVTVDKATLDAIRLFERGEE